MNARAPRPRILHVLGRLDRGGAEVAVLQLGRRLARDVRLDVLATSGEVGALDTAFEELGGKVHHHRIGWRLERRLRALHEAFDYRAIHSHVHTASGFVLRAAARAGIPRRIAQFHSTSDGRADNLRRRLQRRLGKRWIRASAHHVLSVSEAVQRANWSSHAARDERFEVLYYGVDESRLRVEPGDRQRVRRGLGIPMDATVLLHVGRMTEAKNHRRLAEIFEHVSAGLPQAHLVCAGPCDATILSRMEQILGRSDRGAAGRFHALGSRDDVPALLSAADVFVFPSLWEGLGNAALEAYACDVPVVASALPALREVARHVAIELVDPRAPLEDWSQAILHALASGPRSRVRLDATPLSWARAVQRHLAIWTSDGLAQEARAS